MTPIKKNVRVFIASPGDVEKEREIIRGLVGDIKIDVEAEYRAKFRIEIEVSVEVIEGDVPLNATSTPQDTIRTEKPLPSECDIVIVIFWSRFGTPMSDEFSQRKPDGSMYLSGTEYEFYDARAGYVRNRTRNIFKPIIYVYRRTQEIYLSPAAHDYAESVEQLKRLEDFFSEARFINPDGSISSWYERYKTLSDFRNQCERGLRQAIGNIVGTDRKELEFVSTNRDAYENSWFEGREEEIGHINHWMQSDINALVIWGDEGIGKSLLAYKWLKAYLNSSADVAGAIWIRVTENEQDPIGTFLKEARKYVSPHDARKETSENEYEGVNATQGGGQGDRLQAATKLDASSLKPLDTPINLWKLLQGLKQRRFLLILDGFEYEITTDYEKYILNELLKCSPSKIIFTCRQIPKTIETNQILPLAQTLHLEGVSAGGWRQFLKHEEIAYHDTDLTLWDEIGKKLHHHPQAGFSLINHIRQFESLSHWYENEGKKLTTDSPSIYQKLKKRANPRTRTRIATADTIPSVWPNPFGERATPGRWRNVDGEGTTSDFDLEAANASYQSLRVEQQKVILQRKLTKSPQNQQPKPQLTLAIEDFKKLCRRRKWDEAATLFRHLLAEQLRNRGAYQQIKKLLLQLWADPKNLSQLPEIDDQTNKWDVIHRLARAMFWTGDFVEAAQLHKLYIDYEMNRGNVADTLLIIDMYVWSMLEQGEFANAQSALSEVMDRIRKSYANHHLLHSFTSTYLYMRVLTAGFWRTKADSWNVLERLDSLAVSDINNAYDERDRVKLTQLHMYRTELWLSHQEIGENNRTSDTNSVTIYNDFTTLFNALLEIIKSSSILPAFAIEARRLGAQTLLEYYYARQDNPDILYDALIHITEALNNAKLIEGTGTGAMIALRAEINLALGQGQASLDELNNYSHSQLEKGCSAAVKADLNNSLARIAQRLGDYDRAQKYAERAYKIAWGQGESHHYFYGLKQAEAMLQLLQADLPHMPPFDPSQVSPLPNAAEIREYLDSLEPVLTRTQEIRLQQSTEQQVDEKPRIVRNLRWFQIGVIAFFNVKDKKTGDKLTALAREFYALCDDPGPLIPSDSDTLVDPNLPTSLRDNPSKWVKRKTIDEIKLDPVVLMEANYKHAAISIIFIVAEDTTNGELRYIFMSARSERILNLYRALQSGNPVNLEEFGRVVHWTKAVPTRDDIDMMFDNWLFCTHFLPVKLIARKAGGD